MEATFLDRTLGDIACTLPGATRVFHDFGIDYCCHGDKTLAQAAHAGMLDVTAVVARLRALDAPSSADTDWRTVPAADLISHIVQRYHERHREQLPELIRLSRRVEMVHAGKPGCPSGLADVLENLMQELDSHMLKEERVLFPMLAQGQREQADAPILVMRMEHDHHGEALEAIMDVTGKLTLPEDACNTWRALYAGLQEFKEDLMDHIHLENNVLFQNPSLARQGAIHG